MIADTVRGVHLQDFGYQGAWMREKSTRDYWLGLMKDMGLGWVVMMTEGDSCMEVFDGKPAIQWFLDAGIQPFIRDSATLPAHFRNIETVKATVPVFRAYGLRPHWILWNEPGDEREWKDHDVPSDWWDVFVDRWMHAAKMVVDAGANAGFPDGPGYSFRPDGYQHPFIATHSQREYWDAGVFWYAAHSYGKGRPWNYPYDVVTQTGKLYTQAEYDADLDVWANEPGWMNEPPLEYINNQRQAPGWLRPGATILDDDTCWLSWTKVLIHSRDIFGYKVRIAVTEGGWVPRDRPGSGNNIDSRWALTTPNMVAKKTLFAMDNPGDLFAICPWLLASSLMGGSGWETDSWVTGAYRPHHWLEQPVVEILKATGPIPPPVDDRLQRAIARLGSGAAAVQGASEILTGGSE